MSTSRRRSALAIALALVPAVLGSVWAAGGGEEPRAAAPAEALLTSLRRDPTPHLGAAVRFAVQLRAPVEEWSPLLTRFGTEDFGAYSGWSDEHMLWREEDWADSFERLFARRGGPADAVLAAARPHERLELLGVVQDVFLGEPWIEVLAATRLPEFVSEGTILHASRALTLVEEARFDLARGEIERAEAGPLPVHAREELARLRAEVDRREAERAAILREHAG